MQKHFLSFVFGAFAVVSFGQWSSFPPSGGSGGGSSGAYSTSATYTGTEFLPPGGGLAASSTESAVQGLVTVPGAISNLSAVLSAAPGAGKTLTFTWRDNGANQTVTCAISGASATSCSDTSHSFNVAANDLIDIQVVASASVTTSMVLTWGLPGLPGANGTNGCSLRNGTGVPSSGLGVNCDFYIDTAANNIYGPKTAGAWGSGTSIVGPQGATGATGAAGMNGSNGAAGAGYTATSTTSLTIGTGSTSFTTQSGLAYSIGARARASYTVTPTDYMEGLVTSYSGTTLVINVDTVGGSGTFATWNLNVAGNVGQTGAAGSNGTNGSNGAISTIGVGGTSQTVRARLNLIPGSNVTITPADNPGTGSTDVTIASTGGGGGGTPCVTTALSFQYNSAGSFGCVPNLTSDGTNPFLTAISAPATPASGKGVVYEDSSSKNFALKNDAGVVNHGIQTQAGTTHQFMTAVAADGSSTTAQPAAGDLQNIPNNTVIGNTSGVTGTPGSISAAALSAILTSCNTVNQGMVPATGNVTGTVLSWDCTFKTLATILGFTPIAGVGVQSAGTTVGTRPTINFPSGGTCMTVAVADTGTVINITPSVNTALCPNNTILQSGSAPNICTSASGSGTAYTATCATTLTALSTKQVAWWNIDHISASTTPTLAIDGLTAQTVTDSLGAALASTTTLAAGMEVPIWNDGTHWRVMTLPTGSGGGGVSSFSGDGVLITNSSSTGGVTATLATVGAHKYFGNNTGSTAAPAYDSIVAADIPTLNQSTTGNAATATALAGTPTLCSTGNAPTGILPSGNATGCASIGSGGGTGNAAAIVVPTMATSTTFTCPSSTAGTVVTFQPATLSANTTSSSMSGCTSGTYLSFVFVQAASGGPYTVALPSGFDACDVGPVASSITTMSFFLDASGNGHKIACNSNVNPSQLTTVTFPTGTPASTKIWLAPDSGVNTLRTKDSSSNFYAMSKELTAGSIRATGGADAVDTIATPTQLLSALSTDAYISVNQQTCGLGGICHVDLSLCADSSGSPTAQSCTTSPTFVPSAGSTITYTTTTANTGALTINVNSSSAAGVYKWGGSTALASGDMPANKPFKMTYDAAGQWDVDDIGNAPAVGGSVTSVTCGAGLSGGTITTTGTCAQSEVVNAQTGTTYTFVNGDCGKLVTFSNSSAVAVTLPQAGGSGNFVSGCTFEIQNLGTGTVTITPTTSTINGGATSTVGPTEGQTIHSDGTNYEYMGGRGVKGNLNLTTQYALLYITSAGTVTQLAPNVTGSTDAVLTSTASSGSATAPALKNNPALSMANMTGLTAAQVPVVASVFNSGTITVPLGNAVLIGCSSTCSVPVPVPAAGYQICVKNNAGVSTVITLSALGSSAMYPKADDSGYGTAGTGTMVSTAAAGNKVCLIGRDATHYELGAVNAPANWTVN